MDIQRFNERKTDFVKATQRLAEACEQPYNSFIRDSVIQRFEFCWELAWKVLRFQLLALGVEANNPRAVFQEALTFGLIEDGNMWTEIQRMRNLTSHTYDETLAERVYQFVKSDALKKFVALSSQVSGWNVDK